MKYYTPAEEILLSVQEWYSSRGLRVPADELKLCKDEIAVEAATAAAEGAVLMRRRVEFEFECAKEEARLAKEELSYRQIFNLRTPKGS